MIPVQDVMPAALATVLRKAPLCPEKVAFAWRSAVGAAVDAATAVHLAEGVLSVRASGRPWKREIERSATVIRARLATVLGPDVVRRISVSVDTPPDGGRER